VLSEKMRRKHESSTKKKAIHWAAAPAIGLLITSAPAAADTFNFDGSTAQSFTVTTSGDYQIIAYGAQGGASEFQVLGGNGAEIGGTFLLTSGEVINIYVGGSGGAGPFNGGGGGGTFVVGPGNTNPLVVAGGGGGATPNATGGAGQTTHSGSGGGSGGVFQGGGGGGGGGFTGDGGDASGMPQFGAGGGARDLQS
jgi:hypothetical protein